MASSIDEGNNGRVYTTKFGIQKIQKRGSVGHDILTQKRIHFLAMNLCEELGLNVLYVPKVNMANQQAYEMEKISTEHILYPGSPNHGAEISEGQREVLLNELSRLWFKLWEHGFAAWDYELFLQPDQRIAMIDFDKFGFRMTSGPRSVTMPLGNQSGFKLVYFFQNPCFSYDFVGRLQRLGFDPAKAADCFPSL